MHLVLKQLSQGWCYYLLFTDEDTETKKNNSLKISQVIYLTWYIKQLDPGSVTLEPEHFTSDKN